MERWLAIAVVIGAVGYLVDSGMHLMVPGRATISQFTALGELMLRRGSWSRAFRSNGGLDRQTAMGLYSRVGREPRNAS